jgi:hypothetical protein
VKRRPKFVRNMHRIEMPEGAALKFSPEDTTILAEFLEHGERTIAQLRAAVWQAHNEPKNVADNLHVHFNRMRHILSAIDHTIWSLGTSSQVYALRKVVPPEIDI